MTSKLRRAAGLSLALLTPLAVGPGPGAAVQAARGGEPAGRLALVPLEREPGRDDTPWSSDIAALRHDVADHPDERSRHFALVRALQAAGRRDEALEAARAWRARDAYNLVVVRLLGDLYTELGDGARARRTYSAVTELLPQDAQAQRALATVLKQGGDLEGAYQRLAVCARLAPEEPRLLFEWADLALRLDRREEAVQRLQALDADPRVGDDLRVPVRQRLAQIWGAERREALQAGAAQAAERLAAQMTGLQLPGGFENDLKVFLTWDTNRTDVDLWVLTPSGEKVYYGHKRGPNGEALYHDVTTGFGPESFTCPRAATGAYLVQVHYYNGPSGGLAEARGEVQVLLNEGRADESRHVLPYRLFAPGETVTVARVEVR